MAAGPCSWHPDGGAGRVWRPRAQAPAQTCPAQTKAQLSPPQAPALPSSNPDSTALPSRRQPACPAQTKPRLSFPPSATHTCISGGSAAYSGRTIRSPQAPAGRFLHTGAEGRQAGPSGPHRPTQAGSCTHGRRERAGQQAGRQAGRVFAHTSSWHPHASTAGVPQAAHPTKPLHLIPHLTPSFSCFTALSISAWPVRKRRMSPSGWLQWMSSTVSMAACTGGVGGGEGGADRGGGTDREGGTDTEERWGD